MNNISLFFSFAFIFLVVFDCTGCTTLSEEWHSRMVRKNSSNGWIPHREHQRRASAVSTDRPEGHGMSQTIVCRSSVSNQLNLSKLLLSAADNIMVQI